MSRPVEVPCIDYPVRTLDDRLLLHAGTQLTSETVDALIATYKGASYQTLPILKYGTVYQDLMKIISMPPYQVVFDKSRRELTLGIMEKTNLILPALESLNYFKREDPYTYRHILVVFALATIMAQELLKTSKARIQQAMAGQMHDSGKICVPLPVLRKTDPLTKTERALLEHHALAGFVLLSYYLQNNESLAAKVAKEHHERRDGSGYPLGIPLSDRLVEIIGACDVYDALISPRPYRLAPYNNRTALEEITDMATCGEFDWEVIQSLVALNRRDRPPYERCVVSKEKRGTPPADNVYGVILEDEDPPSNGT